jgi:carbon monoxide dehydrogenase subunit G
MELKGEQLLPVSQQAAWEALNDTELLKLAIPGCESIVPIEGEGEAGSDAGSDAGAPHTYDLVMVASVGPVKARFKGKLQLLDLDPPNAYTLRFEGSGGIAGFGKGSAAVRLLPVDATSTQLDYEANASVGGKIAQVGSRLVDMAARKIADNFFENFTAALKERQPGH